MLRQTIGGVGSQSGHIPEEALSDGYAANGVAREVIASATLQDVPPQGTAASSHIDSEGADGQIMNLVAQHSAIPHAKSLPNDLVEEARSDADGGEEVQAMLRQTIGGVGSQSGHIPEEALSDGYAANGVAREVIASATLQDVPPQGTAASSHIVSEGADGQIMNLVAQHSAIPHAKSLPNDLVEEARSDADGGEEVQAMLRQTIGGVGSQSGHISEEALSDGYAANGVAREVIASATLQDVPPQGTAASSHIVSEGADGQIMNLVAQHSAIPHAKSLPNDLVEEARSDADGGEEVQAMLRQTIGGVGSQSGHIPEEALSDGYAANGVAREVIASATLQDVPPQGTAASSHIVSEGADGQIMNLVAQHSAIPRAKSLPNDLVEEARSDADGGEEVQAMLRQTIGGVGSQSGHIPDEALSDGYAANGVAREVIASATLQHVPPQGTAASSHIDSEGADGQIMNLVAQHSAIPYAKSLPNDLVEEARSDADGGEEVQAMLRQTIGGVGSQSGHISEEALSDGYAINGVAREVMASATLQDVPPQGTAASSHIDSEGADGQIMNLVAQHSAIPHAKSLPNDLVEEARSDADGGEEVQAMLRQTIGGVGSVMGDESTIPSAEQQFAKANWMLAESGGRPIASNAGADLTSRDAVETDAAAQSAREAVLPYVLE